MGTTWQPDEHELALKPAHILELYDAVVRMNGTPVREVHKDFIISPR